MRALVVDDSKAIRRIIGKILKDLGFEVFEAGHGKEALAKLGEIGVPDLALVDWNMPEMDGLRLLRILRHNKVYIRFGFVTAQGSPEMREKARNAGANFLISKPFTPETFEEVLGTFMN